MANKNSCNSIFSESSEEIYMITYHYTSTCGLYTGFGSIRIQNKSAEEIYSTEYLKNGLIKAVNSVNAKDCNFTVGQCVVINIIKLYS